MGLDVGNASEPGLALPAAWTERPLFELVRPATGQVSPRHEPYASMTLVAPDHIESETGRLIAKRSAADQGAISGKYLFKAGDVVYSKIRPYLRKAFLADFDGLCSADLYPLSPRGETDPRFVLATLLGHAFSVFAESASARSGIPKINRDELAEFRVAVPPPIEQRAIANALSDVDTLLAKLDQLIAKKRDLKQASMQQLLTGRRRLPGFAGQWTTARIEELADVDPSALPAGTTPGFAFNYISLEDVDRGSLNGWSEQTFATAPSRARRLLKPQDVLVSTVRPNLQSHLLFAGGHGDWVCSTGFAVLRAKPGRASPRFLFECLFSGVVTRQIESMLTGSNYPSINSGDVRRLV